MSTDQVLKGVIFYGIDSLDDLWQLQIPPDEDELILRCTDSAKHLSIVRNATMAKGVSDEPLPKATFDRIIKSVLNLSGYFGYATVHAIRRYLGEKVNAQHDHVDYFQSFAKYHEKGLPTSLPAEEEAAIKQDPHLMKLENEVYRLKPENASSKKVTAEKRSLCLSCSHVQEETDPLEWVQKQRDWKIATRGREQSDDDMKTDIREILTLVVPEHGRLPKTMISDEAISKAKRRQATEDLHFLITLDCTVLYRPGEKPVESFCPAKECGMRATR
ncbi:MAG: hypothetical protein Q9217_005728 [Psora testacea]